MSVKGFKLVSGEEVIARVNEAESTKDKYIIERPRVLVPQHMGNQLAIALIPWAIGAGENAVMELTSSAVAAVFEPIEEISNDYIRQTTGIQLVTG